MANQFGRPKASSAALCIALLFASLVAACGRENTSFTVAPTATLEQPTFANGDFEDPNTLNKAPLGWTQTTYKNSTGVSGTSSAPPSSLSALNLGSSGAGIAQTYEVGASTVSSPYDPDLGSGQAFIYPLYGAQAARLNYGLDFGGSNGNNKNVNTLSQTMTLSAADIDPTDGLAHVRFAIAPVLENPSHSFNQQPYFYVELDNLTTGTTVYHGFNTAGQTGVPWNTTIGTRTGNVTQWLNWQLVDISSATGGIKVGDSVKLSVVASGCALGGHYGRVYMDGTGATVPGIYTSATAPSSVAAGGSLTYTVRYANGGGNLAIGSYITFTMPPNTTYSSNTGGCTLSGSTLTCQLGSLPSGASGSFNVVVTVAAGAKGTITAGNYSISAVNQPTLLGAQVSTSVLASTTTLVDLGVAWGTMVTTADWNTTISYSITVTNPSNTNLNAGAVKVTYAKPSLFSSWSWTCSQGSGAKCTTASGTGNISTLPKLAKSSVTYNITATVQNGNGLGLTSSIFSAALLSSATDPNLSNNSLTTYFTIGKPEQLTVTKSGNTSGGTIVSSPASISCGTTCLAAFAQNTNITLTAQTTGGATVTAGSWSGCTVNPNNLNQCSLSLNANTVVSVGFNNAPTAGGAAKLYVLSGSGQYQSSTNNPNSFATALGVFVADANGLPVANANVVLAPVSNANIRLSAASGLTNSSGIATFTAYAGPIGGSYQVSANCNSLTPVYFSLVNVGAPASLTYIQGGDATDPNVPTDPNNNWNLTPVNTAYAAPLMVLVKDVNGYPVPNITVNYSFPSTGASASATSGTAVTNSSGYASYSATANGTAGYYSATATVIGAGSVPFYLENITSTPAQISVVSGSGQEIGTGTAFPQPLVVAVGDASGNPVYNASVTFTTPSTNPNAVLTTTVVTTDATGQAQITATAGSTAGTYYVTADTANIATPAQFLLINDGTQFIATATGDGQSTAINSNFATPLTAQVTDNAGNGLSGIVVTFTAPPISGGPSATLSATSVTTDSSGLATVTFARANSVTGSYTVSATAPLAGAAATFGLTNTAANANSVTVSSGSGQSAPISTTFTNPLVAVVLDAYGNAVSGATVTFTAVASGGATAVLSSSTATSDANGFASITATAGTTTGSYTVTVATAGITAATPFSLTNAAGAASAISAIGGFIQSTVVATNFPSRLTVHVTDSGNNAVPNAVVTFTAPSSGASATFNSNTVTTDASGNANVLATADTVAGSYLAKATTNGASATFTLVNMAGSPNSITATGGTPQSSVINLAYAAPLATNVVDKYNNAVLGANVSYTVNPNNGAAGVLSNPNASTNTSGNANVTITANGTAGTFTVTASITSGASTTFTLTNLAGSPNSITANGGGGQSATVGTAFTTPVSALVRDASNNPLSGVVVTFTTPGSTSATPTSSTATTNSSGIASVSLTAGTSVGAYLVSVAL